MKRAYRVTAYGETGIIAAQTPGQAKFNLLRTLRSLGVCGPEGIRVIRVRRAPEHDEWAEVDSTGTCWTECYLPAPLKQRELLT